MKIEESKVTKLRLTDLEKLDPVSVIIEDFAKGQGQITIYCYGESWTSFWGAIGDRNISEFFCSCDEHYIAKNIAPGLRSEVYCIDTLRKYAENKGIECWRDDPWNDYEFMSQMYGPDMIEWSDSLPKKPNHEYVYLCRIINAVKEALGEQLVKAA